MPRKDSNKQREKEVRSPQTLEDQVAKGDQTGVNDEADQEISGTLMEAEEAELELNIREKLCEEEQEEGQE